ncbi:MAG: alpha/beta fold hydrolase [Erythrobacter sp.]|uniref:alpha/beta fold hydrolase n=1 Tax=Erythrobacter sp. TaxID=1042 RepID=UPI003C73CCEB
MTTLITRHVLSLPETGRKVHYRRCGRGPILLMVHQSPRSSAEYEDLMRRWGKHFTCIAPDTPGFGQSDRLAHSDGRDPEIDGFADALCAFLDALGVGQCAAYGFHSGGIILVNAVKRQPQRFSCLAIGGYAIWTAEEMRVFGEAYLPEFHPSAYGEHLAWLWNRMLEQSWIFPWFDTREEARLSVAHADVPRVAQAVSEMLDAGNAYRAGYGAVLRAPRDIPEVGADVPPCLITAYDGDPLQSHIDRLGELPASWRAEKVATPEAHQDASLAFLKEHGAAATCPPLAEDAFEGWIDCDGVLIHWRGEPGAKRLVLHEPAGELRAPGEDEVAIDLPGHGQSDDAPDIQSVLAMVMAHLDAVEMALPALPEGDPVHLYPDMTPDRFGAYLQRAWQIARAEAFFEPWYDASAVAAVPLDPVRLEPAALNARARARIRAGDAARRWHETLLQMEEKR